MTRKEKEREKGRRKKGEREEVKRRKLGKQSECNVRAIFDFQEKRLMSFAAFSVFSFKDSSPSSLPSSHRASEKTKAHLMFHC